MSMSTGPASAPQPAVPGLPEYPAITLITKLLVIGGWAVLALGVLMFLGTCLSALLDIRSIRFFGTLRFLALVLFSSLQALLYAAVTSALCFAAAFGLRAIRDIAHSTYISAHR